MSSGSNPSIQIVRVKCPARRNVRARLKSEQGSRPHPEVLTWNKKATIASVKSGTENCDSDSPHRAHAIPPPPRGRGLGQSREAGQHSHSPWLFFFFFFNIHTWWLFYYHKLLYTIFDKDVINHILNKNICMAYVSSNILKEKTPMITFT